jgi:hypothetical protein
VTAFTATAPGYGGIIADAAFGGLTASGGSRITVAGQGGVCLQMTVVVTPAKVAMKVGDQQRFEARVLCGSIDVTGKATISWHVIGNIGSLSNAGGATTTLSASSPGQGAVVAMASVGQVTELGYAMVSVS